MGISKENISKLFLNFGKLADPSGQNKNGTGLGLSICKNLIEKMGGKVQVESEGIGKGTTFIIKMQAISKIEQYSENHLHQLDLSQISSKRFVSQVLNKDFKDILQEQKDALKSAKIDSENEKIDIILDKLCPQAQQVLQEDFIQSNPEFIFNKQIQEESHQFNYPKRNQSNLNYDAQISISDTIKQLKVLIINDEFFILQMLKMMVKKVYIQDIDTAQNGFDGFNMVQQKQYDFIICDLNMPVMDGFECIQKILEYYGNSNLLFQNQNEDIFCPYLVACSAFITQDIQDQALQVGFELIVQSPLTIQILRDQIIVKTLEKKTLIKKQQIKSFKISSEKKQSGQLQFTEEENNSGQQQQQIQKIIKKLENKLRKNQSKIISINQNEYLTESLNDFDLICEQEESSQQSSEQIQQEIVNQITNKIIKKKIQNNLELIQEDEEVASIMNLQRANQDSELNIKNNIINCDRRINSQENKIPLKEMNKSDIISFAASSLNESKDNELNNQNEYIIHNSEQAILKNSISSFHSQQILQEQNINQQFVQENRAENADNANISFSNYSFDNMNQLAFSSKIKNIKNILKQDQNMNQLQSNSESNNENSQFYHSSEKSNYEFGI